MRKISFLLLFAILALMAGHPLKADQIETVEIGAGLPPFFSEDLQGLQATFNWDLTTEMVQPSSVSVTSQGPMGMFSFLSSYESSPGFPVFVFTNADRDIWAIGIVGSPGEYPFNFQTGNSEGLYDLVSCGTPGDACNVDGFYGTYRLHGEIIATPEPSILIQLLAALIAVSFFFRRQLQSAFRNCSRS
jgi:hypothetical protein